MNERAVAAGLFTVLAIGLAVFFFNAYEQESYEHFIAPKGEARSNEFLGGQRLLEQRGYDVVVRNEFAFELESPAITDTVFLPFDYDFVTDNQIDNLMQWVADGGHLIVEIQPFLLHAYDPIFTAIGVTTVNRVSPESIGEDDAYRDESSVEVEAATPWNQTVNGQRDAWGEVAADNLVSIDFGDNEPLWAVYDQFGIFAGQLAYENGRLTAVADMEILHNYTINEADHAFLLTRFVGPASDAGRVWFILGGDFPSLWTLLVERIRYVLIAGAVLLALSLWWAAQRFGPAIAPPKDERKAFIDHIEASGRFLWQHKQGARMLASTQQAFMRDASRRHPALRRFDDEERDRYLARICGVSEVDARLCMQPLQTRAHADFMHQIQTLKTMWTRL